MERRRAPEDRRGHEQNVDRIPALVPAVERSEAVERVADELEDERDRDHHEGRRAQLAGHEHARRVGDEQEVQEQERERGGIAQRARREHVRCEKRPRGDRERGGDDPGVDDARPVAPGQLAAQHEVQRSREDRVRDEGEEIREGRERDDAQPIRPHCVHGIRGDAEHAADRDEVPGGPRARLVQRDADQRRDHGGDREDLEPAPVERSVARQRDVGGRAGRRDHEERAIGARERHVHLIGTRSAAIE